MPPTSGGEHDARHAELPEDRVGDLVERRSAETESARAESEIGAGPDVDGAGEHADGERDDEKATGRDGPRGRDAARADALRRRDSGRTSIAVSRTACSQPSRRARGRPRGRSSRAAAPSGTRSSRRSGGSNRVRTALMPDQPGRAATVAGRLTAADRVREDDEVGARRDDVLGRELRVRGRPGRGVGDVLQAEERVDAARRTSSTMPRRRSGRARGTRSRPPPPAAASRRSARSAPSSGRRGSRHARHGRSRRRAGGSGRTRRGAWCGASWRITGIRASGAPRRGPSGRTQRRRDRACTTRSPRRWA